MSKSSKTLSFPTPKEYYKEQKSITKDIQSLHTKIESTSKSDLKWFVTSLIIMSTIVIGITGAMFKFLWNNFDKRFEGIEVKIGEEEIMTEARIEDNLQQYKDHTTKQIMDLKQTLLQLNKQTKDIK